MCKKVVLPVEFYDNMRYRTLVCKWKRHIKKRTDMKFRITNDGNQQDINDIFEMLKEYNLAHLDGVDKVPLGVFYEEGNRKLAGLTGDTFGNW